MLKYFLIRPYLENFVLALSPFRKLVYSAMDPIKAIFFHGCRGVNEDLDYALGSVFAVPLLT